MSGLNYAALLEAGLVDWLQANIETGDASIVGFNNRGSSPERSFPSVAVVCKPVQDWQDLMEISVQVNWMTNALVDKDCTDLASLGGDVRDLLDNDNKAEINALVDENVQFRGFGKWEDSESDVLVTEAETTNASSMTATAYCVVDTTITTTTTTTTTAA